MTRFVHLISLPVLLMAACTSNAGKPVDLSKVPTLDISATHAIAIEQSAGGLSFVPNNVAPWLGRIILLNTDSSLSSTDIEGRAAQSVTVENKSDVFGLARVNQSGVFLVKNENTDEIGAFFESDDKGNFAPMSYSGSALPIAAFCTTDSARANSASVLTADGQIAELSLAIVPDENARTAPVEQEIAATDTAPVGTKFCATTQKHIFAYSNATNKASIHTKGEGGWTRTRVPTSISAMAPLELNETPYLLLIDNEDVFVFNVSTQSFEFKFAVKSGLSIMGLDKTKFITTTTHNYGGAAFSEGLVAFGQADADRVVFVSRSYLADIVRGSNS